MTSYLHAVSASSQFDLVEAELAKDIWDVRQLSGVYYAKHGSNHLINFTQIPSPFRPIVKQYIRLWMIHHSQRDCARRVLNVRRFLDFYRVRHPGGEGFQELSRRDIEDYLLSLKTGINSRGKPNSELLIWEAVNYFKICTNFLHNPSLS